MPGPTIILRPSRRERTTPRAWAVGLLVVVATTLGSPAASRAERLYLASKGHERFASDTAPSRLALRTAMRRTRSAEQRSYLLKAYAAGHSAEEVQAFAERIRDKDSVWLDKNLHLAAQEKGEHGLIQAFGNTCSTTMVQGFHAELDPLYALRTHDANPRLDQVHAGIMSTPVAVEQAELFNSPVDAKLVPPRVDTILRNLEHEHVSVGTPRPLPRDHASGLFDREPTDLVNAVGKTFGLRFRYHHEGIKALLTGVDAALALGIPVPARVSNGRASRFLTHGSLIIKRRLDPKTDSPLYTIWGPYDGAAKEYSLKELLGDRLDTDGWRALDSVYLPTGLPEFDRQLSAQKAAQLDQLQRQLMKQTAALEAATKADPKVWSYDKRLRSLEADLAEKKANLISERGRLQELDPGSKELAALARAIEARKKVGPVRFAGAEAYAARLAKIDRGQKAPSSPELSFERVARLAGLAVRAELVARGPGAYDPAYIDGLEAKFEEIERVKADAQHAREQLSDRITLTSSSIQDLTALRDVLVEHGGKKYNAQYDRSLSELVGERHRARDSALMFGGGRAELAALDASWDQLVKRGPDGYNPAFEAAVSSLDARIKKLSMASATPNTLEALRAKRERVLALGTSRYNPDYAAVRAKQRDSIAVATTLATSRFGASEQSKSELKEKEAAYEKLKSIDADEFNSELEAHRDALRTAIAATRAELAARGASDRNGVAPTNAEGEPAAR